MSERATELMARYCAGDGTAANELYQLLAGRVLAYLTRLSGDRATAEDVLQQLTLLWRRPVKIETILDGKPMRLGHDGDKTSEELLAGTTESSGS